MEQAVWWLGADDARLITVLGDFGRGKTSFLRQLARTLPAELPGLLPVLVELRGLEKAPTLDELLSQHLVRQGVEDINPVKLRYMIHSGRVGLLFDGFDELELRVGYDNAADYLQVLLGSVTGRAKVVLTSRTQHFRSTEQVKTALGEQVSMLAASRAVVLEDFSDEQILRFLTNLFGDAARARARFDLLGDIGNLLDLAHNPRMLAFIAEMDESRLRAVQAEEGRISAADLYREIIDFWLTEEVKRQEHRRGLPSLAKEERLSACTALAPRLWASTEPTIALGDLSAEVSATLTGLAERGYSEEQASHSIGSGSLLVRTEDGAFAFVHQSIMEWLVADAAAGHLDDPDAAQILTARRMSRLMAEFFADLAGYPAARGWAAGTLADPQAPQAAKQNALAIMDRADAAPAHNTSKGGPEPQNLAGVDLRGQDLTGRDLREANLRGANLRGMRLQHTDLAGADLTGARLVGGSLQGAVLTGSRWTRAALLGTALPGDLAASPELDAAAIAGSDPADLVIQTGGTPASVAFSPDGSLLAVGSRRAAQLIDVTDGRAIRVIPGSGATAVAFSPDGTLLATASYSLTLRVWDVASGSTHVTLEGLTGYVTGLAFSPDGTLLAATPYGRAQIWDLATGTVRSTLPGDPAGRVTGVAFSPDDTLLATASAEGTARIWELTTAGTPETRTILEGHDDSVRSVAFSPDGALLATASADDTARIWDLATGATRTTLEGHKGSVQSVAFSPDGALLATASADGIAGVWELAADTARTVLRTVPTGVADAMDMALTQFGTALVTVTSQGTVRVTDPRVGGHPVTFRDRLKGSASFVSRVAISPDGGLVAVGFDDQTIRVWDPAAGAARVGFRQQSGPVRAMAFSPDSATLAAACGGGVELWAMPGGRAPLWRRWREGRPSVRLRGRGVATAVTFSADGTLLAAGDTNGNIQIWDLGTASRLTMLENGHTGSVRALAFAADGTLLASAAADGTALIWDVAAAATRATLTGHASAVHDVAFSPDGALLATASDDGTIRIWDVGEGAARAVLAEFPRGGYATLSAAGYQLRGDLSDHLWWAIKLCRFAPGELDPYVPGLRRLSADEPVRLIPGG